MTNSLKMISVTLALLLTGVSGSASAARTTQARKPTANRAAKGKKPGRRTARKKPARTRTTQRLRAAARKNGAKDNVARRATKKPAAKRKPNPRSRFKIKNPAAFVWLYDPGSGPSADAKDALRKSYGLNPNATSQTLMETELQASLDLSQYKSAIAAVKGIANDPKLTQKLIGKKGWTIEAKSQKKGTLKMVDFYADSADLSLMMVGGTARWRSVQKLDAKGKPIDDRQQLNVKAGLRRLPNNVVVRIEQGTEVAGLVKNGKIVDKRLPAFLRNHRMQDNPANLIRQLRPGKDVMEVLETPLLKVSQQRYKFHMKDQNGVDMGEGSIDIVEARPTAAAKKIFGKQLESVTRFGRVELEGEHVNAQLSPSQLAMAAQSNRAHGAFDVYSSTVTASPEVKTITGAAGRLTKAVGAKPSEGSKVFESMDRLGFFRHIPGGAAGVIKAQKKAEAKWLKEIKVQNPGFID